jgi:hypothetical protein
MPDLNIIQICIISDWLAGPMGWYPSAESYSYYPKCQLWILINYLQKITAIYFKLYFSNNFMPEHVDFKLPESVSISYHTLISPDIPILIFYILKDHPQHSTCSHHCRTSKWKKIFSSSCISCAKISNFNKIYLIFHIIMNLP